MRIKIKLQGLYYNKEYDVVEITELKPFQPSARSKPTELYWVNVVNKTQSGLIPFIEGEFEVIEDEERRNEIESRQNKDNYKKQRYKQELQQAINGIY